MRTIAFDVMGNDNGVKPAIDAVLSFTKQYLDYTFILVGEKTEIVKYISETERIKIYDAPAPKIEESLARSARNTINSMTVAINLVKDGEADAVISAGNSGLYLTNATLILRRIDGVKRPAFAPIMPTIVKNKKFLLLDVGANVDTTTEMMAQWARMGQAFTKAVLNAKDPVVRIVNIGAEKGKGKDFHNEAYDILSSYTDMNFKGFAEARELLEGDTDVAVIDGYAGNMVLKAYEGAIQALLKLLKTEIKAKKIRLLGALLAKGAFQSVKDTLDYKSVGAAWVLGLNGLTIKVHGGSDFDALMGAFKQIHLALDGDALNKFKAELANNE